MTDSRRTPTPERALRPVRIGWNVVGWVSRLGRRFQALEPAQSRAPIATGAQKPYGALQSGQILRRISALANPYPRAIFVGIEEQHPKARKGIDQPAGVCRRQNLKTIVLSAPDGANA